MNKLAEQLLAAIDEGYIVTFHPTRVKGTSRIAVRHQTKDVYKDAEIENWEPEAVHIVLRSMLR